MTGIVGGTIADGSLSGMTAAMDYESWYETERFAEGSCGIGLVHYGERDPLGSAVWRGTDRVGVIHGAFVDREHLDDLLAGACDRPFLDGEEIRRLRREHLAGEANHMTGVLSSVTTLESWLRRRID